MESENIDAIKFYFSDRKRFLSNLEYDCYNCLAFINGKKTTNQEIIYRWILIFRFNSGFSTPFENFAEAVKKYEIMLKSGKPIRMRVKPDYPLLTRDESSLGSFHRLRNFFTIVSFDFVEKN